jgi:hypothetical protein
VKASKEPATLVAYSIDTKEKVLCLSLENDDVLYRASRDFTEGA